MRLKSSEMREEIKRKRQMRDEGERRWGGSYNRRKKQGFQGCGEAINVAKKLNMLEREEGEIAQSL
jgi:hypothetical protein